MNRLLQFIKPALASPAGVDKHSVDTPVTSPHAMVPVTVSPKSSEVFDRFLTTQTQPTTPTKPDERALRKEIGLFGHRRAFLPNAGFNNNTDRHSNLKIATRRYRETVLSLFDAEGNLDTSALLMASVSDDLRYFNSRPEDQDIGEDINSVIGKLHLLGFDVVKGLTPSRLAVLSSFGLSALGGLWHMGHTFASIPAIACALSLTVSSMLLFIVEVPVKRARKRLVNALQPELPIQYYLKYPEKFSPNMHHAVSKLILCATQLKEQAEWMHRGLQSSNDPLSIAARVRFESVISETQQRIGVLNLILEEVPEMQERISAIAALSTASSMDDLSESRPGLVIDTLNSELSAAFKQAKIVVQTAYELGLETGDVDLPLV